MSEQTFTSAYRAMGDLEFPAFTGLRVMMLPVVIDDADSVPPAYADWRAAFLRLSSFAIQHAGEVGYLTIDEAHVSAGETHRRPGLHVDGWYRGEAGGWGGGGSWGGGDTVGGGTGMLVACSSDGARIWSGTFAGRPDPDGGCEHVRSQLGPAWEMVPGIAYWCSPLCLHEAVPAREAGPRTFVRLSLPSKAPWFHGYTKNPLVRPTGPILPSRAEMGYRP
jgi:hypothetical protein